MRLKEVLYRRGLRPVRTQSWINRILGLKPESLLPHGFTVVRLNQSLDRRNCLYLKELEK